LGFISRSPFARATHATPTATQAEVLVITIEDRPGALGDVAHKRGDARVNITTTYPATGTRLVLAADDLAATTAAIA
jgi:hypothetical protein